MSTTSAFVNDVCIALYANGSSLEALDDAQTLWENSTIDIGNAWLHDSDSDLQSEIDFLDSSSATTQDMTDFFNNFSNYPTTDWSLDLVTELQSAISLHWDSSTGGLWNNMASQQATLIQATSSQDTSTGDTESKACQSALENASSAGQPISNAGDSVTGILSSSASIQAQISA